MRRGGFRSLGGVSASVFCHEENVVGEGVDGVMAVADGQFDGLVGNGCRRCGHDAIGVARGSFHSPTCCPASVFCHESGWYGAVVTDG